MQNVTDFADISGNKVAQSDKVGAFDGRKINKLFSINFPFSEYMIFCKSRSLPFFLKSFTHPSKKKDKSRLAISQYPPTPECSPLFNGLWEASPKWKPPTHWSFLKKKKKKTSPQAKRHRSKKNEENRPPKSTPKV